MARYGGLVEIQAGQMPSAQSNFSWVLDEDCFLASAIDGGSASILNGGGNLRAYTDGTKTTQIPVEIVTFVTGVTPNIQVWLLSSSLNAGDSVYIEADTVAIAQPPVTDPFGRNSVWTNHAVATHLESASSPTDSSGNATLNDFGTPGQVSGKIGDGVSINGDGYNTTDVSQFNFTNGYTLSFWANISDLGNFANIIGQQNNLRIGRNSTSGSGLLAHNGNTVFISNYASAFNLGVLTKYDLVWDESDGNFVIYANGVLTTATATQVNFPATGTSCEFMYRSGSQFLTANPLDELVFKNGKVTQDYVTSTYNNQNSPSTFAQMQNWENQDAGGGFQAAWARNANKLLNWYN